MENSDKEILACISNSNIKYLESGQISKYIYPLEREKAHQDRVSHLIIRFFVVKITPDNEILYLVQKRGKKKKEFAEFYTDSASGHVIYDEKLNLKMIEQNAVRELEEEFGISRKAIKQIIFHDLEIERGSAEVAYIFFGLVDNDAVIKPNPEELEIKGSKFYTKDGLKKLLQVEKSIDCAKKIWEKLINLDILSLFELNHEKAKGKKEVALLIGRFQPLHHGHIHVIKTLYKLCKKVKIGIGSSQLSHTINDPFTSEERRQFIKAALNVRGITPEKYDIFEIPDVFDAKKWVNHVISIVGDFDVAFSNSEWVRQLFRIKGYNIGKKITMFKNKFNGSNVRNLIKNNDTMWIRLVPKEVVHLINKFKGIERIKSLYKTNNKP